MKLTKVQIGNFRSAEDTGSFDLTQVLCLVGKNEAGKTAVSQAIAGLNPHPATPITYDLERDYPRRWFTEYKQRHPKEQALVVSTEWTLSPDELKEIQGLVGKNAFTSDRITAFRRYGDTEPQFKDLPISPKDAIKHLLDAAHFNAIERKPLNKAENTEELRSALEALPERTEKQTALLNKINTLPDRSITGLVTSKLKSYFPKFMYFSHYDRMAGELRLDNFTARKQAQIQPPISTGEQVFIDFLEYAGTSPEEFMNATTYESLNARCEAASNRITAQLLEYWTQNPNLEVEVRVTKAEPKDPPPFNEGVIARARVRNNLHKVTVPFSERSAGFIWFFSFLVKFAQVQSKGDKLILILDEPGLTLHGKAQSDLLRYFAEKLAPHHQVIFTTHSPFMVPADDLPSVRIVEDHIIQPKPGQWISKGTKVSSDSLATDRDSLFPLQGALGYEITQTLFVGKNTLIVEGPGDILYLQAWSSALERQGKAGLDKRWTICPAGGIDKIQPFVSLFGGQKLNIATLSDYAKSDRKKLEALRENRIVEGERLLTFASVLGFEEADAEDVFHPDVYAKILNNAFALRDPNIATGEKLNAADQNISRLVKKAEAFFKVLPPGDPNFDHYTPAEWVFRNPTILDGDSPEVLETLGRAEKVVTVLNAVLKKITATAAALGQSSGVV